jgi:hypothetical protein
VTTKLTGFLSRLEEMILNQEKIGSPTAKSRIADLRGVIPSIKQTIKQYPNADDNQVASWAITIIAVYAPWIINDTHTNKKMADFLTGLNASDLQLSKVAADAFYDQSPQRPLEKNTINRSPHSR